MPGEWDANIKLLYAVDDGLFFTADTVEIGKPFDVIANVEIGENLMESVDSYDLYVSIHNLSQSTTLKQAKLSSALTPQKTTWNAELRVNIDPPFSNPAAEGDVLEAVATFKVTSGVNTDYSTAKSPSFTVAT
jgi:hypothetical protein